MRLSKYKIIGTFIGSVFFLITSTSAQVMRKALPGHLVVLTFDDATKDDYSFVAPILKKYGFGATFFICETPPDFKDTTKYMSWYQISELSKMGFEIGNHTREHIRVDKMTLDQFQLQLKYIENKCKEWNIPKPVCFAYPAAKTAPYVLNELRNKGYLFARQLGNRPYNPQLDNPYLIPGFGMAGSDSSVFYRAIRLSDSRNIIILTFNGVPNLEHEEVSTPQALFQSYMKYLHDNNYVVISMGKLDQYINVKEAFIDIKPEFR